MFHRPGSVSTLRRPAVAIAVLAACGIAGCQKSADDAADALANTSWRLVEIQSMDDATGVKRPEDPSLYTMRLNADGSVSMRLNCNSATGNWKAVPAPTDPSSGQFEFGPLAATSALCPPPSLDEQISGQAQYVRGYLLKDGRLNLSLMADGGIFVWEPHTE